MAYGKTSRAIVLACLVAVSVGLSTAQTPDGQTPANEGVCDELKADGITKGLYGLCVAYCEAQDCDDDGMLTDQCVPSSEKILATYDQRKEAGDPDMPCISAPCPCWSAAELNSIAGVGCYGSETNNWIWDVGRNTVARVSYSGLFGWVCSYTSNDPTMPIRRFMFLNEEQFMACTDQVVGYVASLGLVCD